MILVYEGIVLCVLFTIMVFIMSREPIKTLYNYPPKIQERVKSLDEYKDKIPTNENKIGAKLIASIIILIIACVVVRFINKCDTFLDGFITAFVLWSVVNIYDAIVLDCIWFCHDKQFVFKGTEDMTKEYHDYWFHIKGSLIGEFLGLVICLIVGLIVSLI